MRLNIENSQDLRIGWNYCYSLGNLLAKLEIFNTVADPVFVNEPRDRAG